MFNLLALFLFSGQYVYIEASAPRRLGDKARLVGYNNNPASLSSCFRFFYHMKGSNIGESNQSNIKKYTFLEIQACIQTDPVEKVFINVKKCLGVYEL